ncbi:hypothetical protein Xinn_03830 [Xenorhabdus innexi]|uniref:Uncharacterized protein n=1 Tax=Xenorhabdus innexi TaxID=290109 RepID=A0A2G0N1C8_9GAMM|nr:hypothetical protein Xinn_03830 [Xenorhabdus innexi]
MKSSSDRENLYDYITKTNKYKSRNIQIDAITYDRDIASIILKHFNYKHPDMNALENIILSGSLKETMPELISNLPSNQHKRCIINACSGRFITASYRVLFCDSTETGFGYKNFINQFFTIYSTNICLCIPVLFFRNPNWNPSQFCFVIKSQTLCHNIVIPLYVDNYR